MLESSPNHAILPPTPPSSIHGKIVFHEPSAWCQKDWGPLPETNLPTARSWRDRREQEVRGEPDPQPVWRIRGWEGSGEGTPWIPLLIYWPSLGLWEGGVEPAGPGAHSPHWLMFMRKSGSWEPWHHFVDKSPLVKVIPVVISVVNGCVDWSIKKGWVLKNWWFQIVMLEKRVKSLGLQQEQSSQSWRKLVLNVHWNIHCWVHCWSWNSNTSATWCLEPSYWKRPWCWEG